MEKLAIYGGPKAKTTPNIHMFPGGLEIGEEEREAILEVLDHKYLFRYYGPDDSPSKVRQLEVDFASMIGTRYALAVNSCTSALISSLIACGVGPGDEVIVPGYTFFASAAAVLAARAIPIIAEVDDSLTLDPMDFEAKITPQTKAVIPVHMRGAPCDMDRIIAIARKHKLRVIEDVAQACGGSYRMGNADCGLRNENPGAINEQDLNSEIRNPKSQMRRLGSFGDCNAFSLQYHKIITSGEGGTVVTDDELLYDRAQAYHDTAACWRPDRFGLPRYEGEVFPGVNFRMSELAGAVAGVQLKKLDRLLAGMRANKKRIKEQILDLPVTFRRLNDAEGDTAITLIFFLPDSGLTARFGEALQAEGVAAACVFDKGIPDWHVYAHWKHIMDKVTATGEGCPYTCAYYGKQVEYSPDMCPNTLQYLSRSIQIDIPPQMTPEDCDMVAKGIRKVAEALL